MAVLSCIPLGIAAQDVITRPKKSAKKVTAPAKKTKSHPNLTPEQMYENGNAARDRHDYSEAVKWYCKAGEAGHQGSIGVLAYWYYEGQYVPKDHSESAKWYLKSADHWFAQLMLGKIYYNGGYGVVKDYSEAFIWFHKAAAQNDPEAQFYVGNMYENGYGVAKNLNEARSWYRKSADQSYYTAQLALERLR